MTSFKSEQEEKAFTPIEVTEEEIVIFSNLMHPLKRELSITVKELGKLISVNDVQLSKTDFPNDCREVEEEKIACFNEMQWEKAWSSIETTEEGITILSNMQPQNVLWPIVATDSGIMTSLRLLCIIEINHLEFS